ncbi:uncharacterized protein N7458_009102 [Penicillium daleae]|uniref:Dihydrofolate reductase n=1 Tax=Penicillium daleae TaxID=63821 RepID=A0AAD6FYK8_9EURO|nr:uncharacterized protein N7458_009102 [Penicillium daleae]KAJ5438104.1 hypothetical protein N7458_009102 [Penicillium daleae]
MSFFARATSRAPAPGTTNAIIMGRKTYDSVPKHLRPLGKRISVVISRDTTGAVREGVLKELAARKAKMAESARAKAEVSAPSGVPEEEPVTDALVTHSLDAALSELDAVYGAGGRLGKIYVIGGAEIYGAALRMKMPVDERQRRRPVRIVMTNVVRRCEGDAVAKEFECDTFFPVEGLGVQDGWRTASAAEVSEWVGETVTGEWIQDGEVEVQMAGYERLD